MEYLFMDEYVDIYFYNLNFIGGQFYPVNYIGIKMVYHSC